MIDDQFSQSLRDFAWVSRRVTFQIRAFKTALRRNRPKRQWRNHPQRRLHK